MNHSMLNVRFVPVAALGLALLAMSNGATAETPFATDVLDFSPAPGQWVNDDFFNDPTAALGAPFPGGLPEPNELTVVSLGGFGGSITLAFDHTVLDDLLNPFGMDAIVFGNAFLLDGDPDAHWAECATIEIALDVNGNGLADDRWYLIPGSHIPDPSVQLLTVVWDDHVVDDMYPPELASWIPPGFSGQWTTSAFELPAELFGFAVVRNPSTLADVEGIFGYAEYSPTVRLGDLDADNSVDDPTILPEAFYTVPDDPRTTGVSPNSGGGDAFDIAWAIDPDTLLPVALAGFDFIRLTAAVDSVLGGIGEKSPEIDAVADAAPDPFGDFDDDGDIDLFDAAVFQVCRGALDPTSSECARADREPNDSITSTDWAAMSVRLTGVR